MSDFKLTTLRSSEQKTATWAGGTTTQLYIYPGHSTYKAFDFDYRMSYATVEVPESTFTFMPGVTRHLMILKGAIDLNHTDRSQQHLEPFVPYEFNGEWPTTAKGKVMDFNLMVRNQYRGKLSAIHCKPNEQVPLKPKSPILGLYAFQTTSFSVHINGKEISHLTSGDFVHLETASELTLINGPTTSTVILAQVWNPK